jgi:putative inorganic carbon (HCO3(-)) transporter
MALFWPIRFITFGYLSLRTPVDLAIILLAFVTLINMLITPLPQITAIQILRVLTGIGIFYLIINWFDIEPTFSIKKFHGNLGTLLILLAIGTLVLSVFAFFSVDWLTNKFPLIPDQIYTKIMPRVSDVIHPNVMAGSLIILWTLTTSVVIFSHEIMPPWVKSFFIITALFTGFVLILTQSRGALLALGTVLICFSAFRWRFGWIVLLTAVLISFLLSWIIGLERIFKLFSSGVSLQGPEWRVEVWSRGLHILQDFPFSGIGLGSFEQVVWKMYPFFSVRPGSAPHVHNLFLQIGIDIGLPGLISWLAIFITVCLIAWQLYKYGQTSNKNIFTGIGAGVFLSQIALFAHGLVDAVIWGMVRPAPLVWVIWGIGIASYNLIIFPKNQN